MVYHNNYYGIKEAIIFLLYPEEYTHHNSYVDDLIREFHQKYFQNKNCAFDFFINPERSKLSMALSMMANMYTSNFLIHGEERYVFYKFLGKRVNQSVEKLCVSNFCISFGKQL